MKRGKKYVEAAKLVDNTKVYAALEGLDLACKTSVAKFDASVDVAFRLNIDPRKAEQNIRGAIVLPNGTGKTRKVLASCPVPGNPAFLCLAAVVLTQGVCQASFQIQ